MADLLAYINLSVTLDNSGDTPVIKVRDTGSYPEDVSADITGQVEITQPDSITISPATEEPDIEYSAGVLSTTTKELRLAKDGAFQRGLYIIKYTASAPGYETTVYEKSFQLRVEKPVVKISESLDVFTPSLKVNDITDYKQAGFTLSSVSRYWVATIENLGVIESYDQVLDLLLHNEYYDASYSVSLHAVATYALTGATWVNIKEKGSAIKSFKTEVPLSIEALYTDITAYQSTMQKGCCDADKQKRETYVYAYTLFQHLVMRGNIGSKLPLREMVDDIQRVLNGGIDPLYDVTNEVILPYSFSDFAGFGADSKTEFSNVIEIIVGSGANYRLSSDLRQLTPLNKYGKAALINKKVESVFLEGLRLPFKPRGESVYAFFNPSNGTITLTNGTFADQASVLINTNALVVSEDNGDEGPFDTVFTFSGAAETFAYGMRFEVPDLSSKTKWKFNKIVPTSGLGAVMRLKIGTATVGLANFAMDYLGEPCSFVDKYGIEHRGLVIRNGTVQL